jgi:hypothetical protein
MVADRDFRRPTVASADPKWIHLPSHLPSHLMIDKDVIMRDGDGQGEEIAALAFHGCANRGFPGGRYPLI